MNIPSQYGKFRVNLAKVGLLFFLLVMAPYPAWSAPLVPCGLTPGPGVSADSVKPCEFKHVIQIVQNILNFIIIIAAPIAAIMFAYAGWLYLTAVGDTGKISKAHSVFWSVFVGFVIILSAWLIVKTVSVVAKPEYTTLLGK